MVHWLPYLMGVEDNALIWIFKIKLLRVGEEETPETHPHLYWVADLIIKCQRRVQRQVQFTKNV